eukprot:10732923-Prorocentrum_lima.AAC.1
MGRPRAEGRREQKERAISERRGIQPLHLQILRIMTRRTQIHGINMTGNKKNNMEKKTHTRTPKNSRVTTMSGTMM